MTLNFVLGESSLKPWIWIYLLLICLFQRAQHGHDGRHFHVFAHQNSSPLFSRPREKSLPKQAGRKSHEGNASFLLRCPSFDIASSSKQSQMAAGYFNGALLVWNNGSWFVTREIAGCRRFVGDDDVTPTTTAATMSRVCQADFRLIQGGINRIWLPCWHQAWIASCATEPLILVGWRKGEWEGQRSLLSWQIEV